MVTNISKGSIPLEGLEVAASPGNKFTRIHLDLASDGVTLAMVGAASALKQPDSRHSLVLKPTADGVSLAMVGAASAAQ
ncbi:hypothetical protein [Caballeronia sp. dw_276]|uniref:hypothetical protein n=1 Tax=Caballeronia sp. dw_276 TaxID=2719795 RepID=UPI001BD436F4|nr:hypothetical protein [Caballeronia sp. dw_276]